jgi:hypothetical protein
MATGWLYTCIARNHEGLREINQFLSVHNLPGKISAG